MERFSLDNTGYLEVDGRSVCLTQKQMRELGLRKNSFNIVDGELVYYLNELGNVVTKHFNINVDDDFIMMDCGKIVNNEDLMEQRKFRKDLDDLIFKFAVEHNYLVKDLYNLSTLKFKISYNLELGDYEVIQVKGSYIDYNSIYFDTKEHAIECLTKVVLPYSKKIRNFWSWDYNY